MSDDPQPRQAFGASADAYFRAAVVGAVLGGVGFIAAIWWYAVRDGYNEVGAYIEQPVLFSHQHHVDQLGIDCRYCHNGVEQSSFAGLPSTTTCMSCHSQLFTDSPMLEPVRESLASGKPVRWQRVHDLKDIVYFKHDIHVEKGVSCVSCHGRVDQMPLTKQVESLSMSWCLDCHRNPQERLVPQEMVFDLPAAEQYLAGESPEKATAQYHVNTYNLTNCATCHY